jgi:hypothetical protein
MTRSGGQAVCENVDEFIRTAARSAVRLRVTARESRLISPHRRNTKEAPLGASKCLGGSRAWPGWRKPPRHAIRP